MKKPIDHHLDPATAAHLSSDSKWLTACLTIAGLLALPLLLLNYLLYNPWLRTLVGAGVFYMLGPTLRRVVEVTASVVVVNPLWI